jgi:hypothetical protein
MSAYEHIKLTAEKTIQKSRVRVTLDEGAWIRYRIHWQLTGRNCTNNYNTIAASTLYKITQSLFQPALSLLVVAW